MPQLHLKLHVNYLAIKCADCGDTTLNEYLGTTFDPGVLTLKITCRHCKLTDIYKLSWPDWSGLPATPDLDEASLLREAGVDGAPPFDVEAERMKREIERNALDDEGQQPPPRVQ